MPTIEQLTVLVQKGIDLDHSEASCAAEFLASDRIESSLKQDFLRALGEKGESAGEVAAFAQVFRGLAVDPGVQEWASSAVDVCGTGGDGSSTFNISTSVAFIVAAAGVPVFKHGNRSITSKCGSADLLEAVGIALDAPHEVLRESLRELNFCFFFAPAFHPAFKEIMPVRKALAAEGKRSIFNLLGPLINPGRPAHQLLGVFASQWVEPLAEALGSLGLSAGMVVHGTPEEGRALDELSCAGTNHIAGFGSLSGRSGYLPAADAGLPSCEFSDLAGGDIGENIKILGALIGRGSDVVPAGLRNTILLNAGAALWVSGKCGSVEAGIELADTTLTSGAVADWLARAKDFYARG